MEDSNNDINDSSKKSTRNRPRKYFFFDEFQEGDSPKKKVKKPKKDLKLLLKKGIAPTSSYKREKDLEKKPEKNIKMNAEELKVVKRLKRTNKPAFNPKLFKESKDRRDVLTDQMQTIEDEYGKFMVKMGEPKKVETLWDYVMKEMTEVAEYFIHRRKFRIFKAKKLAAGCQIAMKNRKNQEQQRIKEEHARIVKIADSMAKMVQKEFWKNVQKLNRYQRLQEWQEKNMKSQQKRLENFVNKQLKLSSKMADYLQESIDEATEKEDDEEKNKRHFIIHLKKNRQGYLYDKYTYEKEKAPAAIKEKEKEKEESSTTMAIESVEEKKDSLQEIANLASQYQPKGFTLNTSEVKIKQPFLIKGQLREYQLIGLNWMVMLYQRKINGILADEMGLGKTLQTISLLSYLACEKGVWGPHLIVVPTSILVNWEIEFKRWCPALKVMTYFGTPKERKQKRLGWSRINSFHVCITSYKLALQDKKIFRRKKWYYMILDEAHNIKNFKSQRWQTLLNFKSKRRLLLTGTPLQNDVGELWSLMHFLMPNIFHSQADFSEWFLVPMQQSMQKNQSINMNIIQQLHSILRPFLLRRLKKDVEKQLPSKTEVLIRCPLSRRQKYLYDEFINKNETKNKIKNQEFLSLMNVVMQLRKVCNHPDLFEPRAIESGFHTHQGLRINMPTICLLHHYHKMQNIYSLEGFNLFQYEQDVPSHHLHDIAVNYLPSLEDLFEAQLRNEAEVDQYLHHFSYKWKKIKCDFRNENMEVSFHTNTRRVSFQRPLYGIATIHYIQKLAGFGQTEEFLNSYKLIKPLDSVIFDLKGWLDNYMISYDKVIAYPMAYNPSKYSLEYENIQNNLEVSLKKPVQNVTDQFHYAYVRQQLLFPDKKFLIYDCGKLNTMMQLLIQLKMQKHKVLIFTQMTKMLDVFEFSLNVYHMTYVRLDGGTRPDTRQKLVERFNQDPKIFCFISSTRSGGIGINLTGADVVIFYDTDWNPAMDKQAQDRCHRIGQTRNVTIYRLISEYTIEENILLKNMQKRKLDEFIFEEGNFTMDFLEKINMKDILGDMLYTEPTGTENKMSYQQFQKALKSVEDQDDNNAADQATKEQEEVVLEDMKAETAAASIKGLEDENPEIDRSMLPPIFNYGLDFVEGMEDGTFMETEAGVGTEQEGGNEDEMEEEEEQISEEEDLDFMKESEEDSDDEEESFRAMSAKEAMKTYKDTKKLIYQNYFVNV